MNIVVDNFIETLKEKPLTRYHNGEIADFIEEASILYKYVDTKEDRDMLDLFYNKMAEYYNSIRKDKIYKTHLNTIKHIKGSLSLKDI